MAEDNKLGQYTLLDKIAQGGMAQVFKAKTVDPNGFERLVVIKRILPHISADPEYVEMLVDEAKIAVHFTHGNIAQIYDLGRVKNDYFIVMEYVDGKTVSQVNKKLKNRSAKFPIDILLYCAIETCHGLSYIHQKKTADGKSLGVVHRDISPQNVILSYAGQIKIIDFGVAKAQVKEGKTESGVLKGKFAYMSPEQARSDNIDYRSDIFSMGILLWELATSKRLFKRKTNHETIKAIQRAKYDAASSVRSDLPREFDRIIKKALQKNPKHRYQDAADMALDLEKLLFKINPDFKPVYAAEFIYKLFGPEDDELDLPDHIFTKEPTPVTKVVDAPLENVSEIEDPTIKEVADHATPVVKVTRHALLKSQYLWMIAFLVFLFVGGTVYVYIVNQYQKASIQLLGLKPDMEVLINEEEFEPEGTINLEPEQRYKLVVKKPGHLDFVKSFRLVSQQNLKIKVKHKIMPPKTGNLIIKTKPSGATVYLNNMEWKDKTPVILPDLRIGNPYKIGLFLPKHKFHKTQIKLPGDEDLVLEHDFVKTLGFLSVTSSPIGAEVFIDQKPVGLTPYQDHNVMPDKLFQVQVQLQGYRSQAVEIQLAPGEEKTLNVILEKQAEVFENSDSNEDSSTP